MSKLSAGLINLVMADFMLWDEVKNTVRMFRDDVNARGVVLELDRDPSLDSLAVGLVKGDSGRFIQVIVNLISNAIKFTETAPKRTVRVRVGAVPVPPDVVVHHNSGTDMEEHLPNWPSMDNQEDLLPMCQDQGTDQKSTRLWIYVAVADSGHGMTQEEQDHVFQRFKQANARTYGEFGGHGLGLVCIFYSLFGKPWLKIAAVCITNACRTSWRTNTSPEPQGGWNCASLLHIGGTVPLNTSHATSSVIRNVDFCW
jgi:signal transduction histidine kinase